MKQSFSAYDVSLVRVPFLIFFSIILFLKGGDSLLCFLLSRSSRCHIPTTTPKGSNYIVGGSLTIKIYVNGLFKVFYRLPG